MTPLVIFVDDLETQAAAQYAFIKSPVRIGRSELNDLPLPLPFVSAWHAVVQFDEQGIHYVDLGSTNGSMLDGIRLDKNAPVLVGAESEVCIGTLRLRFSRRATGSRPATPARAMTAFALNVSKLGLAAGAKETGRPDISEPALLARVTPQQDESVRQALSCAAMDLDLLYASYRGAWEHLLAAIEQLVAGLDEPARALALSRLVDKYGALSQEPQLKTLSGEKAAPVAPAPRPAGSASGLLAAFAESYLPAPEVVSTEEGAQQLLGRTAEVLEAFGRSYLEMRKGYEEFGKEMGVRAIRADSPVERSRDAKQLLAYLLDLRAESRSRDLQSAFADLMVHQVALLNGVVEGARGLLTRLSPDVVTEESVPSKWPLKAGAYWKAYEARWHEIADEDDAVSDALFGPEFARAYAAIVGQRTDDEKPESTEPGPPTGRPTPTR
jgi:type VI secretion system protein ImpI